MLEYFSDLSLGNPVMDWLIGIGVALAAFYVLLLIRRIAASHLGALAKHTKTSLDDDLVILVQQTQTWLLLIISLFLGTLFVDLPERAQTILSRIAVVGLFVQVGLWMGALLVIMLGRYRERRLRTDPAGVTTLNAIGFFAKVILWTLVLLLILDNLGFDITALVAGLGIGGVAAALAVQNVLGHILASLSIVFDKPFAIGDFLIIDNFMGSVEHVGLKSTRLRSLSGEQLIISNADLLNSRIRNYGRMAERRVEFNIRVPYETSREKLQRIPQILRESIQSQAKTRFDRAHFKTYGDFALDFEAVYFVLTPDYNQYMDIQQAINLMIHERFEQEGVAFAYPTQTVLVRNILPPDSSTTKGSGAMSNEQRDGKSSEQ